MKKVISILLAVILLLGSISIIANAESTDIADSGAAAELTETKAESWLWPVPSNREITPGRGYSSGHKGIDIPGNTSYDIVATKSGTVLYAFTGCNNTDAASSSGKSCSSSSCSYNNPATCTLGSVSRKVCNYGYGRGVVIKNSDGTYACYAHMSRVDVSSGSKVAQGQVIGKMGNYGFADGVHLHFAASKSGSSWGAYDQDLNPGTGVSYIYSITNLNYEDIGTKFYANIVPTDKSSTLAIAATSDSNVQLSKIDYSDYQKWYFERQSDKSYKITNVKMNKCLDVAGADTEDRTNIQVVSSNNSTAQRWYFVKNGAGYWIIPKCNTSSAIDVKGTSLVDGANVIEYHQTDTVLQRYSINKIVDYTLAYDANGGTGSTDNSKVSTNDKFTVKANAFSKEGYTFAGYYVQRKSDSKWYTESNGWATTSAYRNNNYNLKLINPNDSYRMNSAWTDGTSSADTFTFYAQWRSNNPALQFYGNFSGFNYILDGSFEKITSNVYPNGSDNIYTLSADSSNRLNTQNSLKIVGKSAGNSSNDVRFYTDTARSCVNSDSGGDNKRMTLGFWAKSSVDGAKAYFRWGYISTTKSVTLTKNWEFYSVNMTKNPYASPEICFYFDKAGTFYMNSPTLVDGATSASSHESEKVGTIASTQKYTYGSQYGWLPIPEREGYTFEGWFTAKQGGTQITEDTDVYENEMRVYAHWSKDISFTPIKTEESNGHKYELYDNAMGWEEAESFCESLGGHLITINSAAEQSLAYQMIQGRMNFSWIGVKFYTDEGCWRWVTGDPLTYKNWAADNEGADNTTEYYAIMYPYNYGTQKIAGMWADCNGVDAYRSFYGWHNANFICEYDTIYPDFIELSEDELSLSVGETYKLEAYLGMESANDRIIWSSDDEDIVTVDDNGVVTAISEGKAWISARTVNGLMTRCEVTVTDSIIYPEDIELSAYTMDVNVNETKQLYATVVPKGASQDVIWYSEDDEIATVDEYGFVTGVDVGVTIICAQTEDGSVKAYCSVYVLHPYYDPHYVEENGFGGTINDDGTVYLFSYNGDDRDIIIPSTIEGMLVSEISFYFLEYEKDYDSVTVPKTISTIGYHALGYYVDYADENTVAEEKLKDITIKGYRGTSAESYASEHGFTFVELDDQTSECLVGDADGDGKVTIVDATAIQRRLASLPTQAYHERLADTDEDGKVTILDATAIQRHLAGLPTAGKNIGKRIS